MQVGQHPVDRFQLTTLVGMAMLVVPATIYGQVEPEEQPGAKPALIIKMTDALTYEPDAVTVTVGTLVKWTNPSSIAHTVTADKSKAQDPANVMLPDGAKPFDSGRIAPGENYSRQFTLPGKYKYFCIPHELAGMIGTITVREPDAKEATPPAEETAAESQQPPNRASRDMPAFLRWLGKFHPPTVNFPIAMLLGAALAEVLLILTGRPSFAHAARFCVWVACVAAVFAALLGWLFAGFRWTDASWILTTHRWLGTATAAWTILVLVLLERSAKAGGTKAAVAYRVALFAGAMAVAVTGFFGGAMVYGLKHYAWPG
jgi:plastocyanin